MIVIRCCSLLLDNLPNFSTEIDMRFTSVELLFNQIIAENWLFFHQNMKNGSLPYKGLPPLIISSLFILAYLAELRLFAATTTAAMASTAAAAMRAVLAGAGSALLSGISGSVP